MSVFSRISDEVERFIQGNNVSPGRVYLGFQEYEELLSTTESLFRYRGGVHTIFGLTIYRVNEPTHLHVTL